MPLKIGITGGIGAGKSVVCQVLEVLGYPVFHSDLIARKLMNEDPNLRASINELFQENLYPDGSLDRTRLAALIFNSDSMREELNQLVHPKVRTAFDSFASLQNSPLVFNEAAILFETAAYKQFDATVLVVAPMAIRLKRVVLRDGTSEVLVRDRINSQWSDDEKRKLADFVLNNDEKEPLLSQIEVLLATLLTQSR